MNTLKSKIVGALTLASFVALGGCHSAFQSKKEKLEIRFLDGNAVSLSEQYFVKPSKDEITGLEQKKATFSDLLSDARKADSEVEREKILGDAKALRDSVVADLKSLSDFIYNIEKDALFSGKASLDTGFTILDLALTGTAATVGSESTKAALAAAATFLTGTKLAIDENFYAKQTISSIISVMDGRRAEKELLLINSKVKSPLDYTLQEGIALVQEYHRAGSIIDSVVALNRDSSAKAEDAISRTSEARTNLSQAGFDALDEPPSEASSSSEIPVEIQGNNSEESAE